MMDDVDEYWRRVFHFSPFTVWFNRGSWKVILRIDAPP